MTFPTIHMNGTSAADLLEGYRKAMDALHDAQNALAECGPNGRDYYPQGPEAMTAALAEHWQRREKLAKIHDEVQELAIHCINAIHEREERDKERDARAAARRAEA